MTFHPGNVETFTEIFDSTSRMIRNFPGCSHLELLRDVRNPSVFFTYSYWDSVEDLDRYRQSELFNEVWMKTSALFAEKAAAWSLNRARVIES